MQSISYTIHEPTGIFAIIITKAIGIKGNEGWMQDVVEMCSTVMEGGPFFNFPPELAVSCNMVGIHISTQI